MPIIFNEKVINGAVDGASVTFTKKLPHRHEYTVQAKWSGTAIVGEIKLQASINGVDFIDIPDSVVAITATGDNMWDVGRINYSYVKVVCTSSTNEITFEVWFEIKKESNIY